MRIYLFLKMLLVEMLFVRRGAFCFLEYFTLIEVLGRFIDRLFFRNRCGWGRMSLWFCVIFSLVYSVFRDFLWVAILLLG